MIEIYFVRSELETPPTSDRLQEMYIDRRRCERSLVLETAVFARDVCSTVVRRAPFLEARTARSPLLRPCGTAPPRRLQLIEVDREHAGPHSCSNVGVRARRPFEGRTSGVVPRAHV